MTLRENLDPAARRLAAGSSAALVETPASPIERIVRRWWLIPAVAAAGIVAALIYLALAAPVYRATAVLAIERLRPASAGDIPPDEFLATQRDLFISRAPLRNALEINNDKGQGTMTVTFSSPDPRQAALSLTMLIDAYLKSSTQQHSAGDLANLSRVRDDKSAARAAADKAVADFRLSAGLGEGDIALAAQKRSEQLLTALSDAEHYAASAKADADAVQAVLADPERMIQAIAAARSKGVFDDLDAHRQTIKAELDAVEPQLARQKQTLLAQHPTLQATQKKTDALRQRLDEIDRRYPDAYRVFVTERSAIAQKKVDELKKLLSEHTSQHDDQTAKTARLADLQAALRRADTELADADQRLRSAYAAGDPLGAVMKLVQAPTIPPHPSSPRPVPVIFTGCAIGLLLGAALAMLPAKAR